MDFMEVIKKRRSVRNYSPEPIPDKILNEILEAGRLAPSGGNAQNYYFGIVKEKNKKQALAKAAGEQEWIATAPVIIAFCTKIDNDLAEVPEDDFGLIVNKTRFGEKLVSYLNNYKDRRAMNIFWNNANPLLAGEHIFLAAVNFGLNACWIGYLNLNRAGKILKLPDNMACLFLMPVGYAAEEPEEIERKSLEELVFYEEWKE